MIKPREGYRGTVHPSEIDAVGHRNPKKIVDDFLKRSSIELDSLLRTGALQEICHVKYN
jgi:hypothetical protein